MPLKHLRVCEHCDRIRYAACAIACRVPAENVPDSWRPNLQAFAGQLTPAET